MHCPPFLFCRQIRMCHLQMISVFLRLEALSVEVNLSASFLFAYVKVSLLFLFSYRNSQVENHHRFSHPPNLFFSVKSLCQRHLVVGDPCMYLNYWFIVQASLFLLVVGKNYQDDYLFFHAGYGKNIPTYIPDAQV